jgi:carboxylate-amine ligase
MHVHVGMDSKEKAVAVHDEIRKYLPIVLALSTSSPFWRGRDTELYCTRLSIFQGLPNTGLPEPYQQWSEYEQSLQTLVEAGFIKPNVAYRQVWKDVRIHPEYGTVEIRIADSMPSLKDTVAVATLIQALCIKIGKDWEDGLLEKPTPTWLIENNRWSAIKKGLNAEFILDKTGKTIPIVHMIETLVDELKPIAKNLGSQDKLLDVKSILKDDGIVDSMKQIAKNGSLVDVVIFLEEKLNSSL